MISDFIIMISQTFLYTIDEWQIFVALVLMLIAINAIAFRFGVRYPDDEQEHGFSQVTSFQAASLGMLALLLGFTFSMAAGRFDERRDLVVQETNAIGTALLRAQLLPPPYADEAEDLLKQYVGARVAFQEAGIDENALSQSDQNSVDLQNALWALTADMTGSLPPTVTMSLFAQSLNDVIDLQATRKAALEHRVPEIVFFVLYIVAIFAFGLIGYGCGLAKKRNFVPTLVMIVLISVVIMLITDLDRPRRGLFQVSQQTFLDLEAQIEDVH